MRKARDSVAVTKLEDSLSATDPVSENNAPHCFLPTFESHRLLLIHFVHSAGRVGLEPNDIKPPLLPTANLGIVKTMGVGRVPE
jgi:hypothetical protein